MPIIAKVLKTDWKLSRVASFMLKVKVDLLALRLTHETTNDMHGGNNSHGVLHSRRLESADQGKELVNGCAYKNKGISLSLGYKL